MVMMYGVEIVEIKIFLIAVTYFTER